MKLILATLLIPLVAEAGGLYDSAQSTIINSLPGDRAAISHAVEAAGTQSGAKADINLAESVTTTKAYSAVDSAIVAGAIGAAVFAGKSYRAKRGTLMVNNPLLGRHRVTVGEHEASISEVKGPMGITNSFGVTNTTLGGPLKYTLGLTAHW